MNKKEHDIKFCKAQIHIIKQSHPDLKRGGILALVTLTPLIASVLGGIRGITGGIAFAVGTAKSNNETVRHNKAIEERLGDRLYLKPSGSGFVHKRGECMLTRDYKKLFK